jgi:hypothetical protein
MLSNALQGYSSKYSDDIKNKDYYLYWLENDILLALNENQAMMKTIRPTLQSAFPNMSVREIVNHLDKNKTENEILASVKRLWEFLSSKEKENIIAKFK